MLTGYVPQKDDPSKLKQIVIEDKSNSDKQMSPKEHISAYNNIFGQGQYNDENVNNSIANQQLQNKFLH